MSTNGIRHFTLLPIIQLFGTEGEGWVPGTGGRVPGTQTIHQANHAFYDYPSKNPRRLLREQHKV